jgi:uncharacterized protein (TIGR00369 family)
MNTVNFIESLGIKPRGFEDGQYVVELDVDNQHLNIGGIVHGGVICSLLDTAMFRSFFLALPEQQQAAATLELKVNYLRSAEEGRLIAYGKVVNTTRRTAYVEGGVVNDAGTLVAKGCATLMLFADSQES